MPYSNDTFDWLLKGHIQALNPSSILDVGAGAGKLANIIQHPAIDCIEPTEQYIRQFELEKKYRDVYMMDIDKYINLYPRNRHDFIYFGDVLEHCYLSEVINYLDFFSYRCKWMAVVWPTNALQDDWEGQKFEIHKSNFSISDLTRFDVQLYWKRFLTVNTHNVEAYKPVEMHYCIIKGMLESRQTSL